MKNEIWKVVNGFEGSYSISNHGNLMSFKRDKTGYLLSNVNSKGGYFSVVLIHHGVKKYTRIHILVAEHFISPKPFEFAQVNHKDTNKQNCHVDNLEWCTPSENVNHAIANVPSMLSGINNYNKNVKTTPILQFNLNRDFIAEFRDAKISSITTGVCHRNILQVAHETEYKPGLTRKQAGGFIWKLKNKVA